MKKINEYIDKDNFGNKIYIYSNNECYLCFIEDRGEKSYFMVDKDAEKIYSITSLVEKNFDSFPDVLDVKYILDNLGYKTCPSMIKKMIINAEFSDHKN